MYVTFVFHFTTVFIGGRVGLIKINKDIEIIVYHVIIYIYIYIYIYNKYFVNWGNVALYQTSEGKCRGGGLVRG